MDNTEVSTLAGLADESSSIATNAHTFEEEDLAALQLLRAQEIDELVSQGLIPDSLRFDEETLNSIIISHPELVLRIETGALYPAEQLSFSVENLALPRVVKDALSIELRKMVDADTSTNNYQTWSAKTAEDAFGNFMFEMTALKLIQIATKHLDDFRNAQQSTSQTTESTPKKIFHQANDAIAATGVDLTSLKTDDNASALLDKSLEEICAGIPQDFRVLHVERVIRNDHLLGFYQRQQEIRERLDKVPLRTLRSAVDPSTRSSARTKVEVIEALVEPRMTFHGTTSNVVRGIVQHGFLKPGDVNPATGHKLWQRCGGTYGAGVYSSPNAEFALMYSGQYAAATEPSHFWGLKLLVCAVVMSLPAAMTRSDEWWTQSEPFPGADSHVANSSEAPEGGGQQSKSFQEILLRPLRSSEKKPKGSRCTPYLQASPPQGGQGERKLCLVISVL